MTSLSTRFLGQPRLTNPTLVGEAEVTFAASVSVPGSADKVFVDMQSFDFNTPAAEGIRPDRTAAQGVGPCSERANLPGLYQVVSWMVYGDEMTRALFGVALLFSLAALSAGAVAQKNELTGIIGRTFISDQGVTSVVTPDTILHSAKGLTLEANYGRRWRDFGIAGLTFEVPFVVNFREDLVFQLNLVPKDYRSFFVTPALRANLFPGSGISPWVSAGGGIGHFGENSMLEFGGPNPGKTGTTTGVFQIGGGLDVKLFRSVSLRGQVRDFVLRRA